MDSEWWQQRRRGAQRNHRRLDGISARQLDGWATRIMGQVDWLERFMDEEREPVVIDRFTATDTLGLSRDHEVVGDVATNDILAMAQLFEAIERQRVESFIATLAEAGITVTPEQVEEDDDEFVAVQLLALLGLQGKLKRAVRVQALGRVERRPSLERG